MKKLTAHSCFPRGPAPQKINNTWVVLNGNKMGAKGESASRIGIRSVGAFGGITTRGEPPENGGLSG